MAESQEDKDVDALVDELQATLDRLKAAQRKDVVDEDDDQPSNAKNLKDAEREAYIRVREHNRRRPDKQPDQG